MHKILTAAVISSTFLLASCGSGTAKYPDTLEGKKNQLNDLKTQRDKMETQIDTLEGQISRMDTSSTIGKKAKLVALTTIVPVSFTHYIDLQGNVMPENYSTISPQGNGGVVRSINVKLGDHVNKGQLLLKLDDAVQRQQLTNAQTQLAYAKDIYQRRKNLWDEKIGTEVDLINAKNQVDQAATQVKIYQEQLDWTNVYADISGTVNTLNIKVGEFFSSSIQAQAGSTNNSGQLQIVSTDELKVTVLVPEIYQERVKVGTPVKLVFPGLNNKEITGIVHIAGKVIDPGSRSFNVDIRLPNTRDIRANQVAVVKLQDYTAQNVLSIPVNTLQTDEKGKYVMVAVKDKDNSLIARKRSVTIGQTYADKAEVASGLQQGDQLVTDGFQGLYDGQLLTIQ